jgi:hypothetical protein
MAARTSSTIAFILTQFHVCICLPSFSCLRVLVALLLLYSHGSSHFSSLCYAVLKREEKKKKEGKPSVMFAFVMPHSMNTLLGIT